jgi:glutamyl-tRNA synthetase
MSQVDINERLAKCIDWLNAAGLIEDPDTDEVRDFVHRLILILGDRLRIYSDILGYDYFFRDVIPDEKSFAKRVQKPEALALLRDFRSVLEESRDWSANALEEELKQFVASRNQSTGTLIHALRISITGTPVGPGLFDCLALIGRDRTLARIDAAVRKAEHNIA